ncbi:Acyl-[acyl-carrier-protein]--UDP-N-acetylglucosamine O-acyltransferase [hydrothermal vent metagenome]|uniref:Acyl-[acyl-carrier-protein]--UDP-N-acetylglucosamine O-acyltransferase n=1 Tax=hydrothermal vent metagenome TaxID=652676 RepID=A0A3B0WJZ4_9ZZZZ
MIHPQAIIDSSAKIAEDVSIGPFTVIGANVEIGSGTTVASHVVINGPTKIGKDNRIFQFASVGEKPQDLKFNDEPTELIVGDRNTIREYVTLHRGTPGGGNVTRIGNDNLFMASSHVAHDCVVGNHVILANATALAGHVIVDDYVILGGYTTVHQFTRIGTHAFSGFSTAIDRDVLPFFTVAGNRARAVGINKEGLKRRGYSPETIRALQDTFKLLIKSTCSLKVALDKVEEIAQADESVKMMVDFLDASERGWIR